jgi:hypothetical protein
VREFFFDDDTFTDNLPRAEAIAGTRQDGRHLVVQRQGQRAARDAEGAEGQRAAPAAGGLRKRQPADPVQHQEGHADRGRRKFTKDCHELGIKIHGTFILGLPGETKETIEETIRFATEINPHTIQVSLAAPYPGTFLYKQAVENGWLDAEHAELVDEHGVQIAPHYVCRTPKSSTTWRRSTNGSISARRRSPRSSARWCAARR